MTLQISNFALMKFRHLVYMNFATYSHLIFLPKQCLLPPANAKYKTKYLQRSKMLYFHSLRNFNPFSIIFLHSRHTKMFKAQVKDIKNFDIIKLIMVGKRPLKRQGLGKGIRMITIKGEEGWENGQRKVLDCLKSCEKKEFLLFRTSNKTWLDRRKNLNMFLAIFNIF